MLINFANLRRMTGDRVKAKIFATRLINLALVEYKYLICFIDLLFWF
jgi:hypothetical protein